MLNKSILFNLESFFPSQRAGTEVYVLNLCRYFKTRGWQVSVLIATTNNQKDYEFEGIPVYTFEVPARPIAQELNGLIPPRGIHNFVLRLKDLNPDWVHFHSLGRAINGFHVEAAKAMGCKVALTPHLGSQFCIKGTMRLFNEQNCDGQVIPQRCVACNFHDMGYAKPLAKAISRGINLATAIKGLESKLPPALFQAKHRQAELRRIQQHTDVLFAIAPWIKNAFAANGIEKAQLIPQGISPVFFEQSTKQHKIIQCPLKFVFVGRMHSSKGFQLLKTAWDQIDKNNKTELHIITNQSGGEAKFFQDHKIWASRQKDVKWNEGFNQEQVANYFNDMDVLLLPSISNEVAPLVILEAATRKIPVIASDYIAMQDMVLDGVNGWLFENGNVHSLKTLIENLISHPNLVMEASSKISKSHNMDEVAELIERAFLSSHN